MEFFAKIRNCFGPKPDPVVVMENELKAEAARQLHHARTEYLNSMLKVEYHTANARAAQQTIARLESAKQTSAS